MKDSDGIHYRCFVLPCIQRSCQWQVRLVEHLAKASQRRSLRLVRTIPVHLMSISEAEYEFSAADSV